MNIQNPQHFYREAFLLAFAGQHETISRIRGLGSKHDNERLPTIQNRWHLLQDKLVKLQETDPFLATPPNELTSRQTSICSPIIAQDQFQRTFSNVPWKISMVEAENLLAPQRFLDLDYITKLEGQIQAFSSEDDIYEFCLGCKSEELPADIETYNNQHIFTSPNLNLRFLGSIKRSVRHDDFEHGGLGGNPLIAIVSFVGYGFSTMNAFSINGRMILNNGFHRAYALRKLGWTHVPIVLQYIQNSASELPQMIASCPRDYIVNVRRPPLLKDFFNADLIEVLNIKKRLKIINLNVAIAALEAPY